MTFKVALAAAALGLVAFSSARAEPNNMAFTVEIKDNWSYVWSFHHQLITLYEIRIRNESRERITGFTVTSGHNIGFYSPAWHYYGPSGTIQSFSSGSTMIRVSNMSGFNTGAVSSMRFYFAYPHTAIAARTMFNNGSAPNAVVTVYGADGGRGELTMSDTLSNSRYGRYTFKSAVRPRTLTVNSRTMGRPEDDPLFVPNFSVRVRRGDGVPPDIHYDPDPSGNIVVTHLSDGDKVDIVAKEAVYLDADGNELYDSTNIPPEQGQDSTNPPRQRYVASGLSVNNTPMTGDPTQYSFDIGGDTVVDIRWRHDYALLITHDFSSIP